MKFNSIKFAANKAAFSVRKASPEIALAAGIIGVIFAGVKACQATLKVQPIVDKAKNRLDDIHEAKEAEGSSDTESDNYYPENLYAKDLASTYTVTGLELTKLYGPAIAIGTASLALILTSHHIMRKRNAALAAAYATVSESFKTYRNRLIDRFGEQVDRELRYNIQKKKVNVVEKDENGNDKIIAKEVEVIDPKTDGYSVYSAFFDEASPAYEHTPEYNLAFLRAQQQYANDILHSRGHLFLNEVYDMIGVSRTEAGQIVGWVYNKDSKGSGDNYVDFRIQEVHVKSKYDPEVYESVLMIDPNVDGNILKELF
jgi:hypothetical protein